MTIYLDIETNSEHTHIWLCVANGRVFHSPEGLQEFIEGHFVVAHNGITFDFPLLKKLWNIDIPFERQVDTLVLSRLVNLELEGGHSLEAWGERLGFPKGNYDEWDNPDMVLLEEYCKRDVELLRKVHETLMTQSMSPQIVELEHEVARILHKQQEHGWQLDVPKALILRAEFTDSIATMTKEMQRIFPTEITERYSVKSGKRLKDNVEVFNPGSRKQIAKRLGALGWKPTKHTEKGNVTIDEDVFDDILATETDATLLNATSVLKEYFLIQKHLGMIENWLGAADEQGVVHGYVNSIGAVTHRCTHSNPNLAQVPSKKVKRGLELRSLWIARQGKVLVDIDLSSIELRCLAHYMRDDAWTKDLVSGDVHTKNQQTAGLETRDQAKTFIYALIYGAGAGKIGAITGHSAKIGAKRIQDFERKTPAFVSLKERVERIIQKQGYLPGLDNRRFNVRENHKALNTLLQGAGAIIAKKWMVLLDKELKSCNIEAHQIGFIHDELVFECSSDVAEDVARIAIETARNTQQELGLRCPIDAEAHIGNNWAEVH